MIYGLATLLCFGAFYAFAMAKTPHYKSVFGSRPSQKQTQQFKLAAWIIILLSFLVNLTQAIGYGSLMFCGQMALSVLLIALCVTYKPHWLRSLLYVLPITTGALAILIAVL
ncbi:DUF3325 domain-containing protein [Pseudoalteromonas luteoviolacea]|uniref:DUF3325 domain-containing protein n=1 Tax=Pseudoalteromonas luteoviolacea (strain 2ta16) TaxID=1353533 RepID=V4H4Q8_PSEL2|nr:DUF3325 domain-containing protein [Pseudoalteromonas luteoviolacea]ESP92461.1 protein of unknown function (DUF3325) [Pseudoalteromonas luteoviolacea 2ta16]KZN35021.1 hypothetical protein N483_24060 [Pseudoalteromonas luteoviolacea NCIMB 1944]